MADRRRQPNARAATGRAARRRRQPDLPRRHPRKREHPRRRSGARRHVRPAAETQNGPLVCRSARPSTADRATRPRSSYGAIGAPGQSYLPAHPDTFAELSVLDHNPANSGTFTFADANALNNLPYMTGAGCREPRREEDPLQARRRLRTRPRPVDRQRPALPPRRVVAISRTARGVKERGQDRARPTARGRQPPRTNHRRHADWRDGQPSM